MENSVKVGLAVEEISVAVKEQSQGMAQINLAVGQLDKVTQANAANAEESAAAAQELNAQAEVMKRAVGELLKLVGGKENSDFRLASKSDMKPKAFSPLHLRASAVGKRNGYSKAAGQR